MVLSHLTCPLQNRGQSQRLPCSCIKQTRREHFQTLLMRVLLEWVIEDFTKSILHLSRWTKVPDI